MKAREKKGTRKVLLYFSFSGTFLSVTFAEYPIALIFSITSSTSKSLFDLITAFFKGKFTETDSIDSFFDMTLSILAAQAAQVIPSRSSDNVLLF